jgi:hypothetical protein
MPAAASRSPGPEQPPTPSAAIHQVACRDPPEQRARRGHQQRNRDQQSRAGRDEQEERDQPALRDRAGEHGQDRAERGARR